MSTEPRTSPHLVRLIFGYTDLCMSHSALISSLEICKNEHISYYEFFVCEDIYVLRLPFFCALKLKELLKRREISFSERLSRGIPAFLVRHRLRLGVPVGILLSIILLCLSCGVVWDVRVEGTERLCEEDVTRTLEACGLSVGSRLDGIDVSVIENRALILSDDISWISINLRGTVANVQIRELVRRPEDSLPPAANIVAERGGVILRLEDVRGTPLVSAGDTVGEGQLLVSGILGNEDTGMSYLCAQGKVYAECEQSFEIDIPRSYRKKEYTGNVKCEKYLIFFKKEIKFFSNCGNLYTTYDKIDTVEYLSSPSGDDLPVGIRTVKYLEYVLTDAERSDTELSRIAEYRMSLMLSDALRDSELLKISKLFEPCEDRYILKCKVKCIANIARTREIDITP